MDDHQMRRFDCMLLGKFFDGKSRLIHIGFNALELPGWRVIMCFQIIKKHKADVVPRRFVFFSGIAKAHEKAFHTSSIPDILKKFMDHMDQELPPLHEQEFMHQPGPVYQGLSFVWELVKVVFIALVIIVPVRYFLVQPFFVNGASMEENFHDGDYILIDEISYRFHDSKRGDIAV